MGVKLLRIGILCDSEEIAVWQAKCIKELGSVDGVQIPLVVLNGRSLTRKSIGERLRILRSSGLLLWRFYERLVLNRSVRSIQRLPLCNALQDYETITCVPVKVGKFRETISDADLGKIESHKIDVLVRFGFGILTGKILDVPTFGIWSFHHGDAQKYRGAPPGFWEIANRDPVTGVILQRLTERLDGGVIINRAWLKTLSSYPSNLDRIFLATTHLLANAVRELVAYPNILNGRAPCVTEAPIYLYPRNAQMISFLLTSISWKVRDQINSLTRHQQWTVGVVDAPVESIARTELSTPVRWLPEPNGGYVADPFAVQHQNGQRIAAEFFDWRTGRGHLVEIDQEIEGRRISAFETLRSSSHISYPFVLPKDDETYCIPETAEKNRVEAYVAGESRSWKLTSVLIDDFPALDPTVFEYDGRWWLFCTSAEAGANEFLFAWYAKDPLGPWTAHSMNPVKVDIRSSRPAGRPFLIAADLIRPAQDCSYHYGGRLVLNRIVQLTPDRFEEEVCGYVSPDPCGRYPVGLHTLNAMGTKSLIDGARWTFSLREFGRAICRKFRANQSHGGWDRGRSQCS